jgi:hypothetical protein
MSGHLPTEYSATTIFPDQFITSPLAAAANLIGVITSHAALFDARKSFVLWQCAAHYVTMRSHTPLESASNASVGVR